MADQAPGRGPDGPRRAEELSSGARSAETVKRAAPARSPRAVVSAPPRRIAWIVAPPEVCCLCKEPLGAAEDTSAWNGSPAHRECVRIHLMQRDPAFHESPSEELPEDPGDGAEGPVSRDDEGDGDTG